MADSDRALTSLTVDIIGAYVTNNQVPASELPGLIKSVHLALSGTTAPEAMAEEAQTRATPAQIRRSIRDDGLVSFEDGKAYKTLKRHLTTRGMTMADYRAKWGLPNDYPSTAPSYSAQRSAMAKALGLGQGGRKAKKQASGKRNAK